MPDWRIFLEEDITKEEMERFRFHERTGRPLGDQAFTQRLEQMTCRLLRRRKPGPKKQGTNN